jgi:predicted Zn-dependent protease
VTVICLESVWELHTRWGRNRLLSAGDTLNTNVEVRRTMGGACGVVTLNQVNDTALRGAVMRAERLLAFQPIDSERPELPDWSQPGRFVNDWLTPEGNDEHDFAIRSAERADSTTRAAGMRGVIERAADANLLASGISETFLGVRAAITVSKEGRGVLYTRFARGRTSVTVRDPQGTASGWVGGDAWWRTWSSDPSMAGSSIAASAVEKCLMSRNPVAVEPGRYLTILEPQAVCDILDDFFAPHGSPLDLEATMKSGGELPFWKSPGQLRIGEQIMDERLRFVSDISPFGDRGKPTFGVFPFDYYSFPPTPWIHHGRLMKMAASRDYAKAMGWPTEKRLDTLGDGRFRMDVDLADYKNLDEIIANTKRGLLVTRFADVQVVQPRTWLLTGATRDGFWLIENGKVTKAVKNLRFTESLLTALQRVEQIGPPGGVMRDRAAAICCALQVRDFNFTSLADAS